MNVRHNYMNVNDCMRTIHSLHPSSFWNERKSLKSVKEKRHMNGKVGRAMKRSDVRTEKTAER